jgi:hypothetical protein
LPRLRRVDLHGTQTGDAELLLFANMPRTQVVGGLHSSEFGNALLSFEQARVQFAEGKINDASFKEAEREFHNSVYDPERIWPDDEG